MKYLSGVCALNLASPDNTPGDWHFSAIDWEKAPISDTEKSKFGTWGLYKRDVPRHGEMVVATHVRACLDLIEKGRFASARGMRKNFISNENYTPIIFKKIIELKDSENWVEIDKFVGSEYLCDWVEYKEVYNHERV